MRNYLLLLSFFIILSAFTPKVVFATAPVSECVCSGAKTVPLADASGTFDCTGIQAAASFGTNADCAAYCGDAACVDTWPVPAVQSNPTPAVVGFGANPLCPAGTDCSLAAIIGRVIRVLLGIIGSIALVMFVYGGLLWMTAQGEIDKVKKARSILTWAALGLVAIFAAYMVVQFIVSQASIFGKFK